MKIVIIIKLIIIGYYKVIKVSKEKIVGVHKGIKFLTAKILIHKNQNKIKNYKMIIIIQIKINHIIL